MASSARLSQRLLLPLLLLALAAARAAQAQDAAATVTPLALGGDRLVFFGRKASAIWRASSSAPAAAAPGAAGSEGTPAPANATLALRFGRLAELSDETGEVVRRIPSLARLTPSQISTGKLFEGRTSLYLGAATPSRLLLLPSKSQRQAPRPPAPARSTLSCSRTTAPRSTWPPARRLRATTPPPPRPRPPRPPRPSTSRCSSRPKAPAP